MRDDQVFASNLDALGSSKVAVIGRHSREHKQGLARVATIRGNGLSSRCDSQVFETNRKASSPTMNLNMVEHGVIASNPSNKALGRVSSHHKNIRAVPDIMAATCDVCGKLLLSSDRSSDLVQIVFEPCAENSGRTGHDLRITSNGAYPTHLGMSMCVGT